MESALTDAAIGMFEVLIGKIFRRAEAVRDKQLLETASSATSALDFFVSFGEASAAKRENGLSLDEAVNAVASWEKLIQATAAAKAASRTRKDDDLIAYLPAQYLRIRRFAAPFMAAFTFEGNQQSRDFIDVVMQVRAARKGRRRSTNPPWAKDASTSWKTPGARRLLRRTAWSITECSNYS